MKHRWVYNVVVFGLLTYLLVPNLLNFWRSQLESQPLPEAAPVGSPSESATALRPLDEFSIIAERNLFGVSAEQGATLDEDRTSLEGIPVAEDNLGLELVGTVVGDIPQMNFAVIDNRSGRKQEIYHEDERVGEVLIKRILRNNVIISTEEGDEVLTIDPERKVLSTRPPRRQPPWKQEQAQSQPPRISPLAIQLQRDEVESYFESLDEPERALHTVPYQEYGEPVGVRINGVRPGSVLAKMGLRSGDVIKGMNDRIITRPEQADEFFKSLVENGEITIEIKRGKSTRKLFLGIE